MNYKHEFFRLLDAATQVIDSTDFSNRKVYSFAALQVLKNAVDYYQNVFQPSNPADRKKIVLDAPCCFCGYNGQGYYQSNTHKPDCPFYEIGGKDEREHALVVWAKKGMLRVTGYASQHRNTADGIFDPVCHNCGDPLTTEELICDNCRR